MGRWGDGEMGRWGDGEIFIKGSHSNKVNKILSEVPDSRLPIPDSPPGRD
ncbi:hypothetical protein [Moorena producens]|nr:hypothetical protein [Moorena producens]